MMMEKMKRCGDSEMTRCGDDHYEADDDDNESNKQQTRKLKYCAYAAWDSGKSLAMRSSCKSGLNVA